MHSFEIEVIFVNICLNQNCILVTFNGCSDNILQLNNEVLFSPLSYTKMFGRDERLIQFFLTLYPMFFSPRTRPLNWVI